MKKSTKGATNKFTYALIELCTGVRQLIYFCHIVIVRPESP